MKNDEKMEILPFSFCYKVLTFDIRITSSFGWCVVRTQTPGEEFIIDRGEL
jgi:hypothetical protein